MLKAEVTSKQSCCPIPHHSRLPDSILAALSTWAFETGVPAGVGPSPPGLGHVVGGEEITRNQGGGDQKKWNYRCNRKEDFTPCVPAPRPHFLPF